MMRGFSYGTRTWRSRSFKDKEASDEAVEWAIATYKAYADGTLDKAGLAKEKRREQMPS